eukprot:767109-Hanusia_phi.AAC.7
MVSKLDSADEISNPEDQMWRAATNPVLVHIFIPEVYRPVRALATDSIRTIRSSSTEATSRDVSSTPWASLFTLLTRAC